MNRILKKRIVLLLCAGILLCTLHTTVYATDDSTTEETSYNVDIEWDALAFEYAPLWNPDKHCYGGWRSAENPITVTNMTDNGEPIMVTLSFVPSVDMGITAVFSPYFDDKRTDFLTFSDGQVTFLLPDDAHDKSQVIVNLSLIGEPTGWEIGQYNQIGAIKTKIVPLHDKAEDSDVVPTDISDELQPPTADLPLPESEPIDEQKPPKTEIDEPEQEVAPDVTSLPEGAPD